MILLHLDFLSALLYAAVFLFLIFRAGMLQWFWASIALWLGISVLGVKLMPGMWGMTRAAPLFIPHFYLTLGSIFFFIGYWNRKTDGNGWQADPEHPLLGLFAVSNVSMTLAFVGICALVHYCFSGTVQVFVFAALLKLYALKPVYWFVLQFVLMAVAYVPPLRYRPAAAVNVRRFAAATRRVGGDVDAGCGNGDAACRNRQMIVMPSVSEQKVIKK